MFLLYEVIEVLPSIPIHSRDWSNPKFTTEILSDVFYL